MNLPVLGAVPEPKPGGWLACCPKTEGWALFETVPKAGGAGKELAGNNEDEESDPKVGVLV